MNFFTDLIEGLKISWSALAANKLRSGLTTLGIVIGIVTVTLMGTAIEGLNRAFTGSISAMGSDVLYVHRRPWFIDSHAEWLKMQKRERISFHQFKEAEKHLAGVAAVTAVDGTWQPLSYKNRASTNVRVVGTTDQFLLTSGVTVDDGRFLTPGEVEGGRPVCVIGSFVAEKVFGIHSPIGEQVKIGGRAFEVIGVLGKQGNFLGQFNLDNQVVIPLRQLMVLYSRIPDLEIQVKSPSMESMEDTREEVRGVMRRVRRLAPAEEDDFAINQQEMFIQTFNRVAGMIATVGLFITGLSLFVGGIGIMNIMFVSVAERTREIGIRKAIGAKKRSILIQFLSEAASICLFGGLVALAIAFPVTLLMRKFMPATLSPLIISVALGVSILTGVISGFLPAWRAARMNPVDALRNE
ncbi:MAG TPA: ABC transporter permease [Methylomirabilota bacterium]|nr:ABC transporter permease [Methylomirabilota bacterium]